MLLKGHLPGARAHFTAAATILHAIFLQGKYHLNVTVLIAANSSLLKRSRGEVRS
jgi:hypothetical protein